MKTTGFEIGEIVGMKHYSMHQGKAVILGFEPNNLFDSVQCVKIMIIGRDKPTFTLSDRIVKL
tara:strand:+ start:760 stop:948 length:189 start_codon:yes stop_codon:yes gene_type:complete